MDVEFVDLARDQQALFAMLDRLNKLEAGVTPVVRMMAGGVSSNIMQIKLGQEMFCLKQALPTLKVAKQWHAPIELVFAEVDWLEIVAGIVPDNVPTIKGVDRPSGSFLMEFLPSEQNPCWKDLLLAGQVQEGIAGQLGQVLSRIHQQTAGQPEIVARFDKPFNDANFMALRLDAYLLETARQHPAHRLFFHSLVASFVEHKYVLVHGDISPKNILLGRNGPIILDAECACYGDPAFDIAFLLNHLLLKAVAVPTAAARLSGAFTAFCAGYFSTVDWESKQALELRVAHLLPALLLARVDGKSPVEYLNQEQLQRVRARALHLLDAKFPALQPIQAVWYGEVPQ